MQYDSFNLLDSFGNFSVISNPRLMKAAFFDQSQTTHCTKMNANAAYVDLPSGLFKKSEHFLGHSTVQTMLVKMPEKRNLYDQPFSRFHFIQSKTLYIVSRIRVSIGILKTSLKTAGDTDLVKWERSLANVNFFGFLDI